MTGEPSPMRPPIAPRSTSRGRRLPAQSARRRVEELRRGDTRQAVRALKHGAYAEVLAAPDVTVEVALLDATHPDLDPVRDRRLLEDLALADVQRHRALLALGSDLGAVETDRLKTLTAYESKLAALVERLRRQVHEREQLRIRARDAAARPSSLERYRQPATTPADGEER